MSDIELLEQAKNNEFAKNELYEKYKYILDILIHKYYNQATLLNIELLELKSEALYAFTDAINSYDKSKNAKLSTFISLCMDRRIKNLIKKNTTEKARILNNTYSLDYDYNEEGITLRDLIEDKRLSDPLNNLASKEAYEELLNKIKESLSESEYEVFKLYINDFDYNTIAKLTNKTFKQIDNTIQRLKNKIREIIK